MFHWKPRTLLVRLALPLMLLSGAGAGAVLLTLPSVAAALPNPGGTQCFGSLTNQPNAALLEPYNMGYSFDCSSPITGYSLVVTRLKDDGNNIQVYNATPEVLTDNQVSSTEAVACGGNSPSDGIDCYTLNGANAGPLLTWDEVEGSIDLDDQYCSFLPKGAKTGTPAVPRAIVELIVTDSSGSTDGPFELFPTKACPKVAAVVPAPKTKKKPVTKTKTKPKTKAKTK